MKNKFQIIIAFILGLIVSGITVYALGEINASQITYVDSNNQEKTVDTVLDDLYTTQTTTVNNLQSELNTCNNQEVLNSLTLTISSGDYNSNISSRAQGRLNMVNNSTIYRNYKYFEIESITYENQAYINPEDCYITSYSGTLKENIRMELNHTYEVYSSTDGYKFGSFIVYSKSNTPGKGGICNVKIRFFN